MDSQTIQFLSKGYSLGVKLCYIYKTNIFKAGQVPILQIQPCYVSPKQTLLLLKNVHINVYRIGAESTNIPDLDGFLHTLQIALFMQKSNSKTLLKIFCVPFKKHHGENTFSTAGI